MTAKNLLLTGLPGVGKTTVLRRVAAGLADRRSEPVQGFVTEEIRVSGQRVGFRLETFGGLSTTLAHVRLRSAQRVGRYHVDVAALERVVAAALTPNDQAKLYLIDEIGKMECLSPQFIAAVERLLVSPRPVVATVGQHGGGFMAQVKRRPDVEVWEVSQANRDQMPTAVLAWLAEHGVSAR